jgi:hypothetical protein
MRFLTAAVLFIVSVVLILAGVAYRTIWLPPTHHTEFITTNTKNPLVTVSHSVLTEYSGNPLLVASGPDKVQVAVGRQSDVAAWVGNTSHTLVNIDGDKPKVIHTPGVGVFANPAGSDLWREETAGNSLAQIRINTADDAALLLSSDGISAAPQQVKLTWDVVVDTTGSRILLIAGGIFLFLAIIINWWAWYTMRRDRGPRRRTPRAPQGPRLRRRSKNFATPTKGRRSAKNFAVAGALIGLSLTLSGCGIIGQQANPSVTTASTAAVVKLDPPVVTQKQLKIIVNRIAASVGQADASHNPKLLPDRVAGPALAARQAHYQLQAASKNIKNLPTILADNLKFGLPAASNQWPRVVMALATGANTDALPQMLVLEQVNPRSQYQLWYDIDMLPGVATPAVAATSVGAIPVAPDSLFLKISPNALPTAFGNLIDQGPSSLSAPMFNVANDEFYKQVAQSQAVQKANLHNGKITVTHALGNPNVMSLSTANSGALVSVYMSDTYVIKPNKSTQAVAVQGNEKLLLGAAGSASGIRSVYGTMLLFYVPAVASQDKILTLGATQVLISVRGL